MKRFLIMLPLLTASLSAGPTRYVEFDGTLIAHTQDQARETLQSITSRINYLEDLLRKINRNIPHVNKSKKAAQDTLADDKEESENDA